MMRLKEMWNKVFCKKAVTADCPVAPIKQDDVREIIPAPHDYGLTMLRGFLLSDDYGWELQPYKKVTLTNVADCANKISVMSMMSAWRNTGHCEWEALLAGWFVNQVVEALEKDEKEADITMLFNRDLLATRDRVFTQKQIYDHIIGWFDIVEETDDELKLAIHIG